MGREEKVKSDVRENGAAEDAVRRDARIVCAVGGLFCCLVGSGSHFVFDLTGGELLAGIFFPVNESVWEHLKLVFFPSFIYFAVALPCAGRLKNRLFGAFAATYIAAAFIPVVYYIYTAFTGASVLGADIATFAAACASGQCAAYRAFTREESAALSVVGGIGIASIAVCYLLLTVYAPGFFLFTDPTDGSVGMPPV